MMRKFVASKMIVLGSSLMLFAIAWGWMATHGWNGSTASSGYSAQQLQWIEAGAAHDQAEAMLAAAALQEARLAPPPVVLEPETIVNYVYITRRVYEDGTLAIDEAAIPAAPSGGAPAPGAAVSARQAVAAPRPASPPPPKRQQASSPPSNPAPSSPPPPSKPAPAPAAKPAPAPVAKSKGS